METIRKILTTLMFIVYLLALSMAAFGNERTDSLVRSKARLTNPELLETLSLIPHNCPTGKLKEQLVIEVLVDSKGKVTDYKIPACPDRRYEKRLINRLEGIEIHTSNFRWRDGHSGGSKDLLCCCEASYLRLIDDNMSFGLLYNSLCFP